MRMRKGYKQSICPSVICMKMARTRVLGNYIYVGEFYLALTYQTRQKKKDLLWLRIQQHWPRELQMVAFDVCVAQTHQTTPTDC